MVTMFKRGILAIGYAFCISFNTVTVFYISFTLFFLGDMLLLPRNNEACRAAQSASRLGLIRGRCGSQNTDYVLFINAVLNRFFSLGRIFFPLLPQIHTGPYSDTHHKQRTFGSVVWRPVFVRTCRSGPRFMASVRQRWVIKVYRWKFLQLQILTEKKIKVWIWSWQNSRYRYLHSTF